MQVRTYHIAALVAYVAVIMYAEIVSGAGVSALRCQVPSGWPGLSNQPSGDSLLYIAAGNETISDLSRVCVFNPTKDRM